MDYCVALGVVGVAVKSREVRLRQFHLGWGESDQQLFAEELCVLCRLRDKIRAVQKIDSVEVRYESKYTIPTVFTEKNGNRSIYIRHVYICLI